MKHITRTVLIRNARKFEPEKLTERDHLEDLGVDNIKIDLKQLEIVNQYMTKRGQKFGI